MDQHAHRGTVRRGRLLALLLAVLAAPPLFFFITTPMDATYQSLLGLGSVLVMMLANRLIRGSRRASVFLACLSLLVSSRYLYWRVTETLVFETGLEYLLGYGLLAAELYAWLILCFGYLQTLMPLERRITPLPDDVSRWPSVDVYIPTYNEDLDVVMDTVLAAQRLEYPEDRLNIYLLDDGRRDQFAAFAARAGVGYITRDNNEHAKAGNLNNALGLTDGELVAVFDCDHIPTAGFLQCTLGGFLTDPKLAMLQTPHYFYSKDPFERNLAVRDNMPREGELFYGPVQKGNDFWNATFFCGSCAVIRRAALDEIDGFAVETVTEDAHTALKLQRRGWRTAFLGLPLAAGLATERLALHIGQRARWARGMMQILRVDNPLLGRGLTLAQRLCYLNAMLHFLFPLPRVVFITAPLAYLLLGQNIIASSAEMIFAYALPHLFHAIYTNSRLNGRYRYTFWGEIYESVLAFHLVKPTVVTLWNPRRGKFNVTEKGGVLEQSFFDLTSVRPHLVVTFLLLAGLGWGVVRLFWHEYYDVQPNVMLLNVFWAGFSLFTLLAAIAVARERRQARTTVRVNLDLAARVFLEDGHVIASRTLDVSMTGARLVQPDNAPLSAPVEGVELELGDTRVVLPAVRVDDDGEGRQRFIRLSFAALTVDQRRELVRIVMGRSDAWLRDEPPPQDRPLWSFLAVARCILGLFFPDLLSRDEEEREANRAFHRGRMWRWAMPVALLFLVLVLAVLAVRPALADDAVDSREISLEQLGYRDGFHLRGDGARAGVAFSVPRDEVVTEARFTLKVRHHPILAQGGELEVAVNGEPVRRLALEDGEGEVRDYQFEIDPAYLVASNRIDVRLRGLADQRCPDPTDQRIHAELLPQSSLRLAVERLPMALDLSRLPLPLFDPRASGPMRVHLVLPEQPARDAVRASAITASWLGTNNQHRRLSTRVHHQLPSEHAVVLATNDHPVDGLSLGTIERPGLRLVAHPKDPSLRLLVLEAPDSAGLVQAARYLALRQAQLQGAAADASRPALPSSENVRPSRWRDTSQPLVLHDLVDPERLRVEGLRPPEIRVPFRISPALAHWPGRTVPLRVRYRFPEGDWLDEDTSKLDVMLNDHYLGALPVNRRGLLEQLWGAVGGRVRQEEKVVHVPPEIIHGQNQLMFYFNLHHRFAGECDPALPEDLVSQVYPDTELDLTALRPMASVPDLALFADAGYPFTGRGDLSRSTLVLPARPDNATLNAALDLMARFGTVTGRAALNISVALGADQLGPVLDRHWLAVAPVRDPVTDAVLSGSPFQVEDERLRVAPVGTVQRALATVLHGTRLFTEEADRALTSRARVAALVGLADHGGDRLTVLFSATESRGLEDLVNQLDDAEVVAGVHGDLTVLDQDDGAHSFRVAPTHLRGEGGLYTQLRWALGQRPMLLLLAPLVMLFLFVLALYPLLVWRARRRLEGKQ